MRTINPIFVKRRIKELEEENQILKQKIAEMEGGSLGVRKVSDRVEFIPKDEAITQLTSDGVLKPIVPNVLKMGDEENYLNDVITANITVASLSRYKAEIRDLSPEELDIKLPPPKRYVRAEGRGGEEIGFLAEELPPHLRRGNGYDLKALVAILAAKIRQLEERLEAMNNILTQLSRETGESDAR